MKELVYSMLDRLESDKSETFIPWAAPVPSFGNLRRAQVGTLGINPSNREFVDLSGAELSDPERRFHTLNSLGIQRWAQAKDVELEEIVESCAEYFFRNPYRTWFDRLEPIVSATGHSYYDRFFPACHIDLVPFATARKWGDLTLEQRRHLLTKHSDLLRRLIQSSQLSVLILNGKSVVAAFESMVGYSLDSMVIDDWRLPRNSGDGVPGIAYTGMCDQIGGVALERSIQIFGFNHNIQSSFGVTRQVVRRIAGWVAEQMRDHDQTREDSTTH